MMDIVEQKSRLPQPNSDDEFERVCAVLLPDEPIDEEKAEDFELPEATAETLLRYYEFLLPRLPAGLKMTGQEDLGYFAWEERFTWGGGSQKEFETLKKEYASCDDKFNFVRLLLGEEKYGLMAEVKRTTDKKLFTIPLVDLMVCNEDAKEYLWVDDYSAWFVNFGPEC